MFGLTLLTEMLLETFLTYNPSFPFYSYPLSYNSVLCLLPSNQFYNLLPLTTFYFKTFGLFLYGLTCLSCFSSNPLGFSSCEALNCCLDTFYSSLCNLLQFSMQFWLFCISVFQPTCWVFPPFGPSSRGDTASTYFLGCTLASQTLLMALLSCLGIFLGLDKIENNLFLFLSADTAECLLCFLVLSLNMPMSRLWVTLTECVCSKLQLMTQRSGGLRVRQVLLGYGLSFCQRCGNSESSIQIEYTITNHITLALTPSDLIIIDWLIRYIISLMATPTQTPSQPLTTDAPAPIIQQSLSPQQYFQNSLSELKSWWSSTRECIHELNDWDARSAHWITDFKRDYILSIGDLMNRSICMAIAGGATYKLLSWNKPSLIRRSRNLGASFVVSGWLFVPQLFNPFLPKID